MGVMACSKRGCSAIMCDIIIEEYGNYICHNCLSDMVDEIGEYPTVQEIEDFMNRDRSTGTHVDLSKYR